MTRINKIMAICIFSTLCFIFLPTKAQMEEVEIKEIPGKDYKFLFYKGYSAFKSFQMPVNDLENLWINSGAGNVRVEGANIDEIIIGANVLVSATSAENALNVVNNFLELSLVKEGKTAKFKSLFNFDNRSNWKQAINPVGFFTAPVRKVDLVIKVPNHLKISIDDRSGDLTVKDLNNDLVIHDGSGNLHIENINGNLNIIDGSGDLKLAGINVHHESENSIQITDGSGFIGLTSVNGRLSLSDNSGDIALSKIGGNITLRDSSGNLNMNNITGDIKLSDTSGDINASNVDGNISLNDNSGGIYVTAVSKNVHVQNAGSGDLSIKDYHGNISGDLKKWYK